jgi:hypothetical protein
MVGGTFLVDYSEIAAEAKAMQEAAALAAAERKKQEEASEAFFKAVEICLYEEVHKANPELHKCGLLTGDRAAGVSIVPKQFAAQIRFSYGLNLACEVNFDQTHSMIDVEMTGEPDRDGIPIRHRLDFRISRTETGAVARKVESEQETSGEYEAWQIAEILTVGIIRGHFE